ncbi:unnamed protein product [Acanthoscelides obtectus]|uniref:Uncharacterized protein n=1 Tax=Acanthoscelides obtectus TaxID=200917 RepID=A0A9P0KRT9_ACAOB|nr:unnamed protein product [Acanthoscelides obtectus]CAK1677368.1 hypothetical protein AOBTE_LOCUS31276 [Acanthoscelides obtectus]
MTLLFFEVFSTKQFSKHFACWQIQNGLLNASTTSSGDWYL